MRNACASCLWIVLLASPLAAPLTAADVELTVAFRDGTLTRVRFPDQPLPWRRITDDGQVLNEPLPLSEVRRLNLVKTPATDQVAHVRKLIHQLGDPDFHAREAAQLELVRIGRLFRPIVEQARGRSTDFEINWRLDEVLQLLDPGGAPTTTNYDLLTRAGPDREIQGDVADWKIVGSLRGAPVEIDRSKVLAIYAERPEIPSSAASSVVRVERIPADDDALFPADVLRIDFERGPRGEALAQHTNISETFIPLGVTFATSIAGSYVSVEVYNVGGRSGGRCIANHEPLYQGVMTIRFCKPGNAAVPAGVRHVGFWTSHVVPNGTVLQAFDISGRRIAEIATVQEKRDFLALKSNTPIAYIKILPTDADPDFAIDDLTFDPPVLLAEAGDPDRYSVLLASGERVHAESVAVGAESIDLARLSIGVDKLSVPRSEVAVLVPPRLSETQAVAEATYQHCFVRLSDGSVLRAAGDEGLKLVRFPSLPLTPDRLSALWGSKTDLIEPQDADWQGDSALWFAGPGDIRPLSQWRLGSDRVEAPEISDASFGYADSPLFWFRKPSPRPDTSGVLRLTNGEEIVLSSEKEGFALLEWSAESVTIGSGQEKWTIPLKEAASLVLPGRSGRPTP